MDDYELDSYKGDADDEYPEYPDCPKCGSDRTDWVGGDSVVNLGSAMAVITRYEHYKCANCGHWWRE